MAKSMLIKIQYEYQTLHDFYMEICINPGLLQKTIDIIFIHSCPFIQSVNTSQSVRALAIHG